MPLAPTNVTPGDFYACLMDNIDDAVFFVDHEARVTHWNRSAEELTGHPAEDVIGKSCSQNAVLHIQAEDSGETPQVCPAALVLDDGRPRQADVFFRHRQGHLVPAHIHALPIRDPQGRLAGAVEIMTDHSAHLAHQAELDTLRQNSLLDPLTDTASRRHLEIRIEAKLEEAKRHGWGFGVIAAAIDNFETIRSAHGQQTTDHLIQMAARTFANTLRTYDAMGRWSEARFLAVVVVKAPEDLNVIAERVRTLVDRSHVVIDSRMLGVALNIGVAAAEQTDTVASLADRACRNVAPVAAALCQAPTGEPGDETD